VRDTIASGIGLSADERETMLPSGKQSIFDNRVGWAKTYLSKAGLVLSVRRGVYQLTERGRALMATKPARVDVDYLARYPEFEEFRKGGSVADDDQPAAEMVHVQGGSGHMTHMTAHDRT
jgi:restriction system protein